MLLGLLIPAIALLLRQSVEVWSPEEMRGLIAYTLLALLVKLPVFYRYGLYSRYWRYAGIQEMLSIAGAVGVATTRMLAVVATERVLDVIPTISVPLSLPLLDGALTLIAIAGFRFSERALATISHRAKGDGQHLRERVIIVGAGDAGSMIALEMLFSDKIYAVPVGFVDDDREKHGVAIHGIPVLGPIADLPRMVKEYRVDEVIIAIPTAPGKMIREIVSLCARSGVQSRTVPGMYEILSGKVGVSQLRKVEIDDLLRREPVRTDMMAVTDLVRGRRVLVTGAGGSIGSELCRQILRRGPSELIALGHGENSIFVVMAELNEMAQRMARETHHGDGGGPRVRPVIADIRFPDRIRAVFREYKPEIVFHAAAHKHVSLMELNPAECVLNNVLGTRNLLDAAVGENVEHFVLISTDKAVNPTSIMGACKRVAELLTRRAATQTGKAYVAVRFGNVLGSRGSVVLTFREQIAAGGPLTLTDKDMERFFMLIPEAVQLVLQSAVLGTGGEIFMLDMGNPVKIADLARDMVRLSGLELGRDIEIKYLGRRPGEKLREELFAPDENYRKTAHKKVFIADHASRTLPSDLDERYDELLKAAYAGDPDAVHRVLKQLLPEYTSWGTDDASKEKVAEKEPASETASGGGTAEG